MHFKARLYCAASSAVVLALTVPALAEASARVFRGN